MGVLTVSGIGLSACFWGAVQAQAVQNPTAPVVFPDIGGRISRHSQSGFQRTSFSASVSFSFPEFGGKDKTMMMNMMTGAVAINGGVGVMEMRRPQMNTADILTTVDDVVKTTTEAVAEIAENAHITLRELKKKIAAVTEKKLPKFAQLTNTRCQAPLNFYKLKLRT